MQLEKKLDAIMSPFSQEFFQHKFLEGLGKHRVIVNNVNFIISPRRDDDWGILTVNVFVTLNDSALIDDEFYDVVEYWAAPWVSDETRESKSLLSYSADFSHYVENNLYDFILEILKIEDIVDKNLVHLVKADVYASFSSIPTYRRAGHLLGAPLTNSYEALYNKYGFAIRLADAVVIVMNLTTNKVGDPKINVFMAQDENGKITMLIRPGKPRGDVDTNEIAYNMSIMSIMLSDTYWDRIEEIYCDTTAIDSNSNIDAGDMYQTEKFFDVAREIFDRVIDGDAIRNQILEDINVTARHLPNNETCKNFLLKTDFNIKYDISSLIADRSLETGMSIIFSPKEESREDAKGIADLVEVIDENYVETIVPSIVYAGALIGPPVEIELIFTNAKYPVNNEPVAEAE